MFSGKFNDKIIKPDMRARQILVRKAKTYVNNRDLVDSIPWNQVQVSDLHMKRPGIWAPREDVQRVLGIGFSTPRLRFSARFLSGQTGNFAQDKVVSYPECLDSLHEEEDIYEIDNLSSIEDLEEYDGNELYEL